MTSPTFAHVAEERHRIADMLDGLTDEQWSTPSCCGDWTVEGVAAHLLVGPLRGVTGSVPNMVKARFDLNRSNVLSATEIAAELGRDGMVAALREHADSRFAPPGFGPEAPLTDTVIHAMDIARPLGIDLAVPVERFRAALTTATSWRYLLFSARKHLKELRFEATDLDYRHGDGPLVSGAAADLAHAMWGRVAAIDALAGDGVATLRGRLGG